MATGSWILYKKGDKEVKTKDTKKGKKFTLAEMKKWTKKDREAYESYIQSGGG